MRGYPTEFITEPYVVQRDWTVDGVPVLECRISLPQPVHKHGCAPRIRRYYRLQSRAFLRYCEHQLFPAAQAEYHAARAISAPLPCFSAELTYNITFQRGGLWSLYTQSKESTLPGQTLYTRRGDTWDLRSGFPLSLPELFLPKVPWKRQLLSLIAEEIRRQEQAGISQYYEERKRKLRGYFNPQNFYLTDEALAVFFPMYSIAPAIERTPVFLIPYQQLDLRLPQHITSGET